MKKVSAYAVIFVMLLVTFMSCSRGPKVIPRAKFAHVYAELLIADQWAIQKAETSSRVDTCLFYEGILRTMGYTTADYIASVDYYLDDPYRYSKILKKAKAILQEQENKASIAVKKEAELKEALKMHRKFKWDVPFYKDLLETSLRRDTIGIEIDSLGYLRLTAIIDTTKASPLKR